MKNATPVVFFERGTLASTDKFPHLQGVGEKTDESSKDEDL